MTTGKALLSSADYSSETDFHCGAILFFLYVSQLFLQVKVLPSVDAEGRAMPGNFGRESAGQNQIDVGRRVKILQSFEGEEKQKYFRDDDRNVEELVREQRHHASENIDANLAENIARKSRFR